jgi:ATP phosphoribosyltransferase regulatory subunit
MCESATMSGLADRLTDYYVGLGCTIPDIGLLQPADPLLDTAGEDLRRRIFITADQHGASLCLRPEFTIPVCLHHLGRGAAVGRYGYAGKVFRQRRDGPPEFMQAGIEDIGAADSIAADVAALADCVGSLALAGVEQYSIVVGDKHLFEAVVGALQLPRSWQERLGRVFGDPRLLADDLERLSDTGNGHPSDLPGAVAAMVREQNHGGVRNWVATRMVRSSLPASGGRTAEEITERALEKAELEAARLDADHRAALDAFLAIEAPLADAPEIIAGTARRHNLEIGGALAKFERRVQACAEAGLPLEMANYQAGFGRRLNYYTGLVFEIFAGDTRPIAGGGRYDRLMTLLGAASPVPAVGFSIWLDRLEEAR